MTSIFKKPDLHKKEREAYLKELDEKIIARERELEDIRLTSEETKRKLDESLAQSSLAIKKQIEEIDSILKIKQMERIELEKPIDEKRKVLDERELKLNERSKSIEDISQAMFERDRALDIKLEGLQDLADSLGETRVRLGVKEKLLDGREQSLKEKEANYLVRTSILEDRTNKIAADFQSREYSLGLKLLNVQGLEENLQRREKELFDGYVLLNDRRTLLEKGFKELKEKQYGRNK